MDEFNGIGQAFSDTVAEDFLENLNQHRPDCPVFAYPYELCSYCNPPNVDFNEVNYLPSPRISNSLPSHGNEEQARPFSSGRTYAQVAGHSAINRHPSQSDHGSPRSISINNTQAQTGAQAHVQGLKSIEQWMKTSTVVAASAPKNSVQLTYAQVAQQAAQQAHEKNARLRQAQESSWRANQRQATSRIPGTPHIPSRGPQMSMHHTPPQFHNQQRGTLPPNARSPMSPGSQYRHSFNNFLPQVQEEIFQMPLQPEANPDPRDVNTLVQRTQRGAHRQSLTPNTTYGGVSTPMSPGTLSDASFSSARSNRRTGQAQFDPIGNPHRCPTCARTFPTTDAERRHERNAHTDMNHRRHRCKHPGCTKTFNYPKDLLRHAKVHGVDETHPCPYCPKSYTRADNLNRHVRTDHAQADSGLGTSIPMSRSTSNTSYSYN